MLCMTKEYTRMNIHVNTRMNIHENTRMNDYLSTNNTLAYSPSMGIGNRLDEAMKKAGYKTQAALEAVSGVPQPTIARILKGGGKRGPESDTVKKLAAACGVKFSWLMFEQNDGSEVIEPVPIRQKIADYETSLSPKINLVYVTEEELSLLTNLREADEKSYRLILSVGNGATKDQKKIKRILKPAS